MKVYNNQWLSDARVQELADGVVGPEIQFLAEEVVMLRAQLAAMKALCKGKGLSASTLLAIPSRPRMGPPVSA